MGRPTKIKKLTYEQKLRRLTPEQREFLAKVVKGKTDPVYFAEELLGIHLHDKQKLWLWMTTRTQTERACELGIQLGVWKDRDAFGSLLERNPDFAKNILIPSNRWGKTLVTSVKHIWYNYYKKGVRGQPDEKKDVRCGTLNLSPHSNQCQAGYDFVCDILNSRFVWVENGKSFKNECKIPEFYVGKNDQKRKISFMNGTTYQAIPTGEDQASSLAGNPYLYISYDECAQSLHLRDELPAKIMSRLIDYGGPLDLVSTPEVDKPSHQYFSHIAKLGLEGKDGWWTLLGSIVDNTFLGEKERDLIMKSILETDPAKYRQVMYGEFVTTGKKMFDSILIERLWDAESPQLPVLDRKYLLVGDWGFADTGDPTVFMALDYTDLENEKIPEPLRRVRLSYCEEIKGGSPFAVLARAKMLQREWNGAKFIHDASALGGVLITKMLKEMEMQDMVDFSSSGGQKADMLFSLLVFLTTNRNTEIGPERKIIEKNPDFGKIRSYYIAKLEEQMGNYHYNPDKGVTDKKLEQDYVMALGMGVWWLERKFNKNKVKSINFNPLAPTFDTLFPRPVRGAEAFKVKTIVIPEKRIL